MVADDADTIVAVATPAGSGARGIVRLSGPDALDVAAGVFRSPIPACLRAHPTYTASPGRLSIDGSETHIPATAYVMRSPYSYTREDVVEIHTTGSPPVLEQIVEALLRAGSRYAQPGEFTKRAYLRGRLDLTQAEAVLHVIRSRTDADLQAGLGLLSGGLSKRTGRVLRRLSEVCAHVEACIDFSDQDIDPLDEGRVRSAIEAIAADLAGMSEARPSGILSGCDVAVVLRGQPNVGKSSLMNALVGQDRALVSDRPGTTRDVVAHQFSEAGVSFRVSDTAGTAAPDDGLARRAEEKTRSASDRAHILLLVFDARRGPAPQDEDLLPPLSSSGAILVANKIDLLAGRAAAVPSGRLRCPPLCETSALTGEGIQRLRAEMARLVLDGDVDRSGTPVALNARHRAALAEARHALRRALENTAGQLELMAADLREAMDHLGDIVGTVTPEDVLDRIFSEFCIGK